MKKSLVNIVRDALVLTAATTQIVCSPVFERPKAAEPTQQIIIDKTHGSAYAVVQSAFNTVRKPEYITLESALARPYVESRWNPRAVSPKGARGLNQIMSSSWQDVMPNYGFDKAFDPYLNTIASIKHINKLDQFFKAEYPGFDRLPQSRKLDLINAAYNGGQGRLKNYGWNINRMPKETRDYVVKMRNGTVKYSSI